MLERVLAIAALAACSPSLIESRATDSDRPAWLELEGAELEAELAASPVREAPVDFVRLGVQWDADAPAAIELATSVDRRTWSAWTAAEVVSHELEDHGAFVGVVEVGEPARYVRIRGGPGGARFVALEFLETSYADAAEDGDLVPAQPAAPAAVTALHSRASWGARPPRCASRHAPDRFTVHHTVTPTIDTISPAARLRNLQAYHQDVRGWCDLGYHYVLSRDGQRWEGRSAAMIGSHVADQNDGNIGIALLGTYELTSATEAQLRGAGALIGQVAVQYGIARTRATIQGHRERGTTSCPGDKLSAQLPAIVAAAAAEPDAEPPPDATPTIVKGVVYRGTDPTKRIPGARVTVNGRAVTASGTGYFEVGDVTGATITVSASAPGYEPRTIARAPSGPETWASVSLSPAAARLDGPAWGAGGSTP